MVPMFDNLQISIAWTMLLVMAYTCTQKKWNLYECGNWYY